MVKFPEFVIYYGPKFDMRTGEEIDDSISDEHGHSLIETGHKMYKCSRCGLKAFYERECYRSHTLILHKVPTCEEYAMHEALK